jgi:membrane protease YdiL (CAAX protease family)
MLFYTALVMLVLEYVAMSGFFRTAFPEYSSQNHGLYPQLWWAVVASFVYLLPALAIVFIFKEKLSEYGMRFRVKRKFFLLYIGMYLVALPLVIYVSTRTDFRNVYPFFRGAYGASTMDIVIWECFYLFQFFALEFFFRGFLVIGLQRYIGKLSVWVAMVPYMMMHFHKPVLEAGGAIIAGIILGEVARRTGSILGGVIVHAGIALTMDMLALGIL